MKAFGNLNKNCSIYIYILWIHFTWQEPAIPVQTEHINSSGFSQSHTASGIESFYFQIGIISRKINLLFSVPTVIYDHI